jgi:lipid II:glycine glycyltransferase (peptidoglycan interpeptide bridge formation enzyme)
LSYHAEYLNTENEKDWETFNQSSRYGSFYHTLRWKDVLEDSFAYKSKYFLIYDNKDPVALCPFFEQPLKGLRSLVPPPFTDLKHIILTEPSNTNVIRTILDNSIRIANEDVCAFVMFVNSNIEVIDSIRGICTQLKKRTTSFAVNGYFMLDLEKNSPAYIWANNLKGKYRQNVGQFERAGFEFKEVRSQKDMDIFYEYYSKNLFRIGVVPFNRPHFDIIINEYAEDVRITLLEKDNLIAGGLLTLLDRENRIMYMRYLALNRDIDKKYQNYHATESLYWEALTKAYEIGCKAVCFGTNVRDKQNKSYIIKQRFGAHYEDYNSELMPMNPIYGLFHQMYRYQKRINKFNKGL